jgi:2-polyprenyl-6-methoxyphenol hydroxylase-like FAD-dependent oxidoreductase
MMASSRALVIGAGIGGLTLAIALARKGITAEIAELTADANILGIGIALGSPALRALNGIGLMEQCVALGFAHVRRTICNLEGEVLSSQQLPRLLGPKYPAQLGIPRPVLHRLLLDTCRNLGVAVHFGITATALKQKHDAIEVILSNGDRRTYDVVIGADGIYSRVRTMLCSDDQAPSFTGLGAWRIRAPRPVDADGIVVYRGGNHWVGFNPVTDDEGYIFIVEAIATRTRISQRQLLQRLPEMLAGYGGLVSQILPKIGDLHSIVYRPIEVILQPPPWFRGNAILIGDAAHAPAPSLAAGALLAIEDAVVLGEELSSCSTIPLAFENFMKRRYDRCRLVVEASIELGKWQKNRLCSGTDPDILQARVSSELLKSI